MIFDAHQHYCEAMRRTYGQAVPLPSRAAWSRMASQPAARLAGDFDIEAEQRDGWCYQPPEPTAP